MPSDLPRPSPAISASSCPMGRAERASMPSAALRTLRIDSTCASRSRLFAIAPIWPPILRAARSEEHTSELQSLMRISYAVFCLKKKTVTHESHKLGYHLFYAD